ncbi:MAG: hypothetical protein U9N54_01435, partial [candidate division Zixibacteria bacterium]|nr:hypothetical protein [candidate division Zixibacteria bacterium]
VEEMPTPLYPKLNVYGASIRGVLAGGVVWLEGGYYDSRQDADGDNPYMPNSTIQGLFGFGRQIATNLTANIQWQVDMMLDYDFYEQQQIGAGMYVRDETKHMLTSRITKLLYDELITLSGFVFYSPSEEDMYIRLSTSYKYTDEVSLMAGANIFDGNYPASDFGTSMLNDNLYLKLTYGF